MSTTALLTSNASDGTGARCTKPRAVRDDEPLKRYLARALLDLLNANGLNPGNVHFDTIDQLPGDYSNWGAARLQGNTTDIYIAGHPTGKDFRSNLAYFDHFTWLQFHGLAPGCPCCLCTGRGRTRSEGLRTPLPTVVPPLQVTTGSQTTAPTQAAIGQTATTMPVAAAPSVATTQALPMAPTVAPHAPIRAPQTSSTVPIVAAPTLAIPQAPLMAPAVASHAPTTIDTPDPSLDPFAAMGSPQAPAASFATSQMWNNYVLNDPEALRLPPFEAVAPNADFDYDEFLTYDDVEEEDFFGSRQLQGDQSNGAEQMMVHTDEGNSTEISDHARVNREQIDIGDGVGLFRTSEMLENDHSYLTTRDLQSFGTGIDDDADQGPSLVDLV